MASNLSLRLFLRTTGTRQPSGSSNFDNEGWFIFWNPGFRCPFCLPLRAFSCPGKSMLPWIEGNEVWRTRETRRKGFEWEIVIFGGKWFCPKATFGHEKEGHPENSTSLHKSHTLLSVTPDSTPVARVHHVRCPPWVAPQWNKAFK